MWGSGSGWKQWQYITRGCSGSAVVFTINAGIKINTSVDRRREQQKEKSVSASDGQCPEVCLFLLILGGVGIADIVSNIERKSSTRGGGDTTNM